MQKHRSNLRQADEAAPQRQEFDSPQAELAWLKENRQDLKGFVRVLEVIDEEQRAAQPFFSLNQSSGHLNKHWLRQHRADCGACAGALLCWFFGDDSEIVDGTDNHFPATGPVWPFENGFRLLDERLGFPVESANYIENWCLVSRTSGSSNALKDIICEMSGDGDWSSAGYKDPGDAGDWPVPHLDVFKKLSEMYPDK